MASYHPTYGDVWNDERLGDFEARSFFIFLFSNARVRPSGIYRATDEQLAVDTGLPVKRVRAHLERHVRTGRIVREGAWLFVCGYLKRQPKGDQLLRGVRADVASCTSLAVLQAFGEKYPLYSQWSADRRATVGRPLPDGRPTVSPTRPAEQSSCSSSYRAVQSRAVQSNTPGRAGGAEMTPPTAAELAALNGSAPVTESPTGATDALALPDAGGPATRALTAGVDPADVQFLTACPPPYGPDWLGDPDWWISLTDGYPAVALQTEASKYMAHQKGLARSAQHKNVKRGFREWVATEARWRARDAQRQAQAPRPTGRTR
jgi:hypothetical protein